MTDKLDGVILGVLARGWSDNSLRREYMGCSLPDWPLANLIEAPLSFSDFYVAARREVGAVTRSDIAPALDRHTLWQHDVVAPFGRGDYSYRLVAGPEHSVLLRLGDHPNNGIMCVFAAGDGLDIEADVAARLPVVGDHPRTAVDDIPSTRVASAVQTAILAAWENQAEYSSQGIASEILPLLADVPMECEAAAGAALSTVVQRQITAWSHRLLIVSIQSTLGDVLAFDLLTLPSGETFVTEWADEGGAYVIGRVSGDECESVLDPLRSRFLAGFEDGSLTGANMVVLGKTLEAGETYPVEDDGFWRDLLGFPFILERT